MANPYEYCYECNCTTDRAGAADDSLYAGDHGPFCQECFDALVEAAPRYKRERDKLLEALRECAPELRSVAFGLYGRRGRNEPLADDRTTAMLERANAAIAECGEG